MPRKHRSFAPRCASHLTAHGVDDEPIFLGDYDRSLFIARLRRVTERVGWTVAAWCLMTTHYHLVVVAGDDPRIPWAMQALNGVYAREFNQLHHRRGHLFGDRYRDTPILSEDHLRAACGYVLLNPVTAGLVQRVEEWAWSGDHRLEPRQVRRIVTSPRRSRDPLVRRGG